MSDTDGQIYGLQIILDKKKRCNNISPYSLQHILFLQERISTKYTVYSSTLLLPTLVIRLLSRRLTDLLN